jgi:putative hemolysin
MSVIALAELEPITDKLTTAPAPPRVEVSEGRYRLRFARTHADLDAVLRLRFEVFNLELGEGLESSFKTGRDRDEFDEQCHHLMVEERGTGRVVGTYRLQTGEMAAAGRGFYSAGEFDLSSLPGEVALNAVELGRACIAKEHRQTSVLYLLWKGLAAYVAHERKRYLFGCCSLTSRDAREGWAVTKLLSAGGHFHRDFFVPPRPGFECDLEVNAGGELPEAKIPRLFRNYLRFGAKVCGPPAIDRAFGTIDYFVLLDVSELDEFSRRMLFGR